MSPDLYILAGPLILLGVPLVLFADRNLDHQRQNMREGKEYLWQEKFRTEIGNLIYLLDRDAGISSEMIELKEALEDGTTSGPDGVDNVEDIPLRILKDSPFKPSIREVTDAIGDHSRQIAKLESNYQDLTTHLRAVGITFIFAYIVLSYGQLEYGNDIPGVIIFGTIAILAFGAHNGYEYVQKKKELRKYADKFESVREV